MLVLLIEVIYEAIFEMALCGMISILSFIKIGTGVHEILSFCLRNLKGCNIGITDRGDQEVSR
jgi:hypothetical protein